MFKVHPKTFISTRISHPILFSYCQRTFPPPPLLGHIVAPLSSLVGWDQGGWDQGDVLRRGVAWEGEAAVVPRHPRVVMPRMTACYSKKDPLLDGSSPPPDSWLCQLRQSSHACWGPTCLERSGHAHQVCSPRGLHARTADKACQGRSGSHAPCRLLPQPSQGSC